MCVCVYMYMLHSIYFFGCRICCNIIHICFLPLSILYIHIVHICYFCHLYFCVVLYLYLSIYLSTYLPLYILIYMICI